MNEDGLPDVWWVKVLKRDFPTQYEALKKAVEEARKRPEWVVEYEAAEIEKIASALFNQEQDKED